MRQALFTFCLAIWVVIITPICYVVAITCGAGPLLTRLARIWMQGETLIEKVVLGLTHTVKGRENLPQLPYLVALQHQSAWETMKLSIWFDNPAIVLKQQLLDLPLWGKAMRIYGSIPVARTGKMADLKNTLRAAKARAAENRPIIIFPHGTRMELGKHRPLQRGIGALYESLNIPVVPVTLNSGTYWSRDGKVKRPGHVNVEILPAIPPGLGQEALMEKLEALINQP